MMIATAVLVVSSMPSILFLEALLLRKATRIFSSWNYLKPFAQENWRCSWMDFLVVSFVVTDSTAWQSLSACLNGAESWTKLQLIVFAVHS